MFSRAFSILFLLCLAFSVSSSMPADLCSACISFWGSLRDNIGCNQPDSAICTKYLPWMNHTDCLKAVDDICAAGCDNTKPDCSRKACTALHLCRPNGTRVDWEPKEGSQVYASLFREASEKLAKK